MIPIVSDKPPATSNKIPLEPKAIDKLEKSIIANHPIIKYIITENNSNLPVKNNLRIVPNAVFPTIQKNGHPKLCSKVINETL